MVNGLNYVCSFNGLVIPEGATGKEIAEILEGDKKVTLQ